MQPKTSNEISIQKYSTKAANYDTTAQFTMPLRKRAIALLQLKAGDVVLDVGAGTGLSYDLLCAAVGPSGRVLAFEQSPDMFKIAQERVLRANFRNVWHVCMRAENIVLPQPVDAILFNYVHDISRSPAAIKNIMRCAKPGARVAMAGMKFFPWWTGPLNILAWFKNKPYNVHAVDLWAPWDVVQSHCNNFKRESTQWGMGYIAHGQLKKL